MLGSAYGTGLPTSTNNRTPSSQLLTDLLRQAPGDYFTLGWLLSALHQRSFGVVILFLGVLATAPIGSMVPGIMLAAVAVQMIVGIQEPIFPRFITERRLPTQYLFRLGGRAIPVLRYLERVVHPRWPRAFEAARHFVGIVVLLLTAALLLTPIPFSNIAPAVLVVLIALAYIEEDGLLLCVAFFAAFILISVASLAVWGTIFSTFLISTSSNCGIVCCDVARAEVTLPFAVLTTASVPSVSRRDSGLASAASIIQFRDVC
jgi:hypothetical protein